MRFEVQEIEKSCDGGAADYRLPLRMQAAGRERADSDSRHWVLWWRGIRDRRVLLGSLRASAGWIIVQIALLRSFAANIPWIVVVVPSLTLLAATVSASSTCVRNRVRGDASSRN